MSGINKFSLELFEVILKLFRSYFSTFFVIFLVTIFVVLSIFYFHKECRLNLILFTFLFLLFLIGKWKYFI